MAAAAAAAAAAVAAAVSLRRSYRPLFSRVGRSGVANFGGAANAHVRAFGLGRLNSGLVSLRGRCCKVVLLRLHQSIAPPTSAYAVSNDGDNDGGSGGDDALAEPQAFPPLTDDGLARLDAAPEGFRLVGV